MLTSAHVTGTEVVVVRTAHSRHRIVGSFKRQRGLFAVVCYTIQTANQRETELTALHVVHLDTVDVDFIVLLVKSTIAKTHRAEQESHF